MSKNVDPVLEIFDQALKAYELEPYFGFLLTCFHLPHPVFKQLQTDTEELYSQLASLQKKIEDAKSDKARELEPKIAELQKKELSLLKELSILLFAAREAYVFCNLDIKFLDLLKKTQKEFQSRLENSPNIHNPNSFETELQRKVQDHLEFMEKIKEIKHQCVIRLLDTHAYAFEAKLLAAHLLGILQGFFQIASLENIETLRFQAVQKTFLCKAFQACMSLPDNTVLSNDAFATLILESDLNKLGTEPDTVIQELLSLGMTVRFTQDPDQKSLISAKPFSFATNLHPLMILKQYEVHLLFQSNTVLDKASLSAITKLNADFPAAMRLSLTGQEGKARELLELFKKVQDQGLSPILTEHAQDIVITDYTQHEKFAGGASSEIELPQKPHPEACILILNLLQSGLLPRFTSQEHYADYLVASFKKKELHQPVLVGRPNMHPIHAIRLIERAFAFGFQVAIDLPYRQVLQAYFTDSSRKIQGIQIPPSFVKKGFLTEQINDPVQNIHQVQLWNFPMIATEDKATLNLLEKLLKTKGFSPLSSKMKKIVAKWLIQREQYLCQKTIESCNTTKSQLSGLLK